MKKTLLTLAVGLFGLSAAFSQATNSQISGNDKTSSGDGYTFEFKKSDPTAGLDDKVVNCLGASDNSIHNIFDGSGTNSEFSYNAAEEALDIKKKGTNTILASSRLTTGACLNIISSPVDVSSIDTSIQKIYVRVKSTVANTEFRMLAGWLNGSNFETADRGVRAPAYQTIKAANTYDTLVFPIGDSTWKASGLVKTDLSKIVGIAFQIKGGASTLTFDYIRIGGGVRLATSNVLGEANFDVFPNPASEEINFSKTIEEVSVFNLQGLEVISESNVDRLDVSELEAGLYVIRTSEGYKRIVIE